MSIKVRLLLSYMAMLVVPLVLFILAALIIGVAFIGDMKSVYHGEFRHGNFIKDVIEKQAAVFADIQTRAAQDPESLLNPNVAGELENLLEVVKMGLVIRKGSELPYVSDRLNGSSILQSLPAYINKGGDSQDMKKTSDNWYWYRQHDFIFADGTKGSAFVITDVNFVEKYVHKYSFLLIGSLFFILLLTNGVLTYLVSRSIIRPLRKLKQAAEQIREGNLDSEVGVHTRDEIGELSIAFEQMRHRLKESVELQLQYEENRKELLSNISHDLKTPVTSIKGYVEGILDGVAGPDKLEKYLQTIYAKTVDMDRMIDELFLFSKLDLKKLSFHFETVELVPYLEDLMEEAQFDMEKKGFSFSLDLGAANRGVKVSADREKLKRVLTNIWENAVKYADKEYKAIRVGLIGREKQIIIEIEDNGQGIPQDALPYVFDRFYRADLSRNSLTGGSGLGLAIAKQIIMEHGGAISAESVEGEGTRISITLPAVETMSMERGQEKR
ncbi:sensor histidine kinase [Paenibacillus radicis (ex Xue et al. 2023)]|uniref:histidine kinase n=1 Tax=Paenibacillus radicis (ex Xue et al. 2023) TaxID=2972489 RepID=A0ABT1YPA2_9BACL|nr:HAMP domain-containing sensor histidine kinase [Paenibacillus radicis (ex Xue et al. 2023)]MCR8634550.1 HAMP domain-containing histidine kinase [Paenibacillus radicis (ex Xue et al. 2023)]